MSPLVPVPPTLVETRLALHRLAAYVVAPARRIATGNEIALTPTAGGFGTPPEDAWGQLRVADGSLVARTGDGAERTAPIGSLAAAAAFAGIAVDPANDELARGDVEAQLPVDPEAAALIAAFHALVGEALATLRGELTGADDPSPVHLWPEHFDVAIDAGDPAIEERGSWGGSPGDDAHPEPYLYVSLWSGAPAHPFFGETAFAGASLTYAELRAADDPRERALAFWREARALI